MNKEKVIKAERKSRKGGKLSAFVDFFKKRIFFTILLIFSVLTLCGCASLERECKSCKSDLSGGLDRIVIVYDMNGNEMARYEGKLDLATEDGCVQFEYEGKRIVWYNAIVSIIEK